MSRLLVDNPKGYVVNFLGYQNKQELNIAMEIFLAEVSLAPDYYTFARLNVNEVKMQEMVVNQLDQYRNAGYQKNFDRNGILKVIYYFHFLQWVMNQQAFNEEQIFWIAFSKTLAREIIQEKYGKHMLRSRIAKALFERNLMLSDMFVKSNCFIAPLKSNTTNETTLYNKMLGAMTLQHRELYNIEVERLKNHSEYILYERFVKDLESAYQLLFEDPVQIKLFSPCEE